MAKRAYVRRGGLPPSEHGTIGCYKGGCRCDVCREANRVYSRRWRDRGAVPKVNRSAPTTYYCQECGQLCQPLFTCLHRPPWVEEASPTPRRGRPSLGLHGTHAAYVGGCRCEGCRCGHNQYMKHFRERSA